MLDQQLTEGGGWLQLELERKARGGAERAALALERALAAEQAQVASPCLPHQSCFLLFLLIEYCYLQCMSIPSKCYIL